MSKIVPEDYAYINAANTSVSGLSSFHWDLVNTCLCKCSTFEEESLMNA